MAASSARRRTQSGSTTGHSSVASGFSSSRTSTSAAIRRRQRHSHRQDGRLGSLPADGRQHRRGAPGATIILWKGYCSVHARFSVEQIENARDRISGRQRRRPSRVPHGSGAGCRRQRLDRAHHQCDNGVAIRQHAGQSAQRSIWSIGCKKRCRTRRSSASIRSSAHARRCTGCTRPTSCGHSSTWSKAKSSIRSRSIPRLGAMRLWRLTACSRSRSFS